MNEKKERILMSSLDQISNKGLAHLKISDIALQANVGKGTVYEYFPSKDQLILESVQYGTKLCLEMITKQALKENHSFEECVKAFSNALYHAIDTKYFIAFASEFSLMISNRHIRDEVEEFMKNQFQALIGILTHIMEKGQKQSQLTKPIQPADLAFFCNGVVLLAVQKAHQSAFPTLDFDQYVYDMACRMFT